MSANIGYRPPHDKQRNSPPIGVSASPSSGEVRARQRRWYDPLRKVWGSQPPVEQVSFQPQLGGAYNATNHHHAPATTIQHASSVTMVNQGASDDLLLLGDLPRHPDISAEWRELMPNSRDGDLGEAWRWIDSPVTKELIFRIHGPAGLGKSALARQLKDDLRSRNRLAASIFLSRLPIEWGPETIIRLIGGEIGRTHRRAVPAVAEAVRQCHGASLGFHIEHFIRNPLLTLQLPHPLIIIIDSVTEWTPHTHLIEQLAQLEPYTSLVRFIILGRSEPTEDHHNRISIRSHALAPVSVEVMAGYLDKRFATMKWRDGGRPSPDDVLRLAALADGRFPRVEEVVSIIRDLPPSEYDNISDALHDKAWSARRNSEKPSSSEELEHLVLLYRVALALRPPGHPERHHSLNGLATALESYRQSKPAGDLEEEISLDRETLALRPPGHPNRQYSCYNLAISLHNHFMKNGLVGHLDEAISLGREALQLCPERQQYRFDTVNNLRITLYTRFTKKDTVEDLQEAITLAEEAFSICPNDNKNYAILPGRISFYKAELARVKALTGTKHDSEER